ncbi:MAG: translocation/assembly module TamB domain-containing protein [Desulfovibrionaceae bacterium]|nr:translocation/assembly module TamB domain-containing protein [Desulfovibrionaceae bacterium]
MDSKPAAPAKESRLRKQARRLIKGAAALCALLLMLTAGGLIWLRTDSAADFLLRQAGETLAGQGLSLKFNSVSGPLPGHLKAGGVELSDRNGVWLRAELLELDIALAGLLSKALDVRLLKLENPQLIRLPVLPPAPTPTASAEEPADEGFSLVLPLEIRLELLSITNAAIPWELMGAAPTADLHSEAQSSPSKSAPEASAPSALEGLLEQAMRTPLLFDLTAHGELIEGTVTAELQINARAGEDLGFNLRLAPARFAKQDNHSMEIDASALLDVRWQKRSDQLKLLLTAAQHGSAWKLDKFDLHGLGLDLAARGDASPEQKIFNAELSLQAPAGGEWQSICEQVFGVKKELLSAAGDPLQVEISAVTQDAGHYSIDIPRLHAGLISGKGRALVHMPSTPGPKQQSDPSAPTAALPVQSNIPSAPFAGTIDADLQIKVEELAPFHTSLGGSLEAGIEASGNFEKANFNLRLNSPALSAANETIEEMQLKLEANLENLLQNRLSGEGSVSLASKILPGKAKAPLSLNGGWLVALDRTPEKENILVQLNDFMLTGLGMTLDASTRLELTSLFFHPLSEKPLLWPQGMRMDGDLKFEVNDWAQLSAISNTPVMGDKFRAQLALANIENVQNAHLSLHTGSMELPEHNLSLTGLAVNSRAAFKGEKPDIELSVSGNGGKAAEFTWSDFGLKVNGTAGKGDFSLNVLEADSTTPGQKKRDQLHPGEMLDVSGSYDLAAQAVELTQLHAAFPDTKVALRLQSQASLDFGENLKISGLDLKIEPQGSLKADADISPNRLQAAVNLSNLPVGSINALAGTALPDGNLNALIDIQSPTRGKIDVRLHLDKYGAISNPPPQISGNESGRPSGRNDEGKAPPSVPDSPANLSLNAVLGKKSGRPVLDGGIIFYFPNTAAFSKPEAGASAPLDSRPPLIFSLPLAVSKNGLPLPDTNAPFTAALNWMGEVAPLWELASMPDQTLSGMAQFNFQAGGNMNAPRFEGQAYLAGGKFEDKALGLLISDISLQASATSKKDLNFVLSATDGAKGKLGLEGSLRPDSKQPLNLRGRIEHFSPLQRDDLSFTVSGLAHIYGPFDQLNVDVDTIIEKGEIVLLDSLMAGSPPTLEISDADSEIQTKSSGPNLNIKVNIPRQFYIRGRGLDSEWQGKLAITGSASAPDLRGSLNPVRGQFDLFSRNFSINEGSIDFAGGAKINPALNLTLAYNAEGMEAKIIIGGTADSPKLTLESAPPLPQDEVLAHVLFGKNMSELSRFEALQLASGLHTLTSGGGFSLMTEMREVTGLDVLRFGSSDGGTQAPQATGLSTGNLAPPGVANAPGDQGGATLEAGKYINDSIYVGVEKGITQESTAVRVEIELFPNVTMQGSTSTESSQVGLGWKKDY